MSNNYLCYVLILALIFPLKACINKDPLKLSFDINKIAVYDINKKIIKKIEIEKLNNDSTSYVCSTSFLKLPKADGLYEIELNNENNGYKKYNLSFDKTPCLIEKGFVYKIKGYALGSIDSFIVKY